jgi:hypothetical protein
VVHFPFFSSDGVARWLAHVDLLLEVAIEEGELHIHVVDIPPFLSTSAWRTRTDSMCAKGVKALS